MVRTACSLLVVQLGFVFGCGMSAEKSDLRAAVETEPPDAGVAGPAAVADQVEIVRGVSSRNRDPAVVAIEIADVGFCTGTLISPRLVLTARHCLSRTVKNVACPATGVQVLGDHDPTKVSIVVGDELASGHRVARGAAVVAPSGVTLCDADIAILVLDQPVKTAKPLLVRSRGASLGERLRAVGFGKPHNDAGAGTKLVREHVAVSKVSVAEFAVGEATCLGDSGGPALDEDTGEIVGVVSRGGPTCEGPDAHNLYTRADAFTWLVDEAFAQVAGLERELSPDAGAPPPLPPKGSRQKPASDLGGPCAVGGDCAAGVCIKGPSATYCSRSCGPGDRCPARYRCEPVAGSRSRVTDKACVAAT